MLEAYSKESMKSSRSGNLFPPLFSMRRSEMKFRSKGDHGHDFSLQFHFAAVLQQIVKKNVDISRFRRLNNDEIVNLDAQKSENENSSSAFYRLLYSVS